MGETVGVGLTVAVLVAPAGTWVEVAVAVCAAGLVVSVGVRVVTSGEPVAVTVLVGGSAVAVRHASATLVAVGGGPTLGMVNKAASY